jgi:hypothetical protein
MLRYSKDNYKIVNYLKEECLFHIRKQEDWLRFDDKMAVSVVKYRDVGLPKYLNNENPIGPDYLEPESVVRINFTGDAHLRRFSHCNLYGGETLGECQEVLEDLISNARINFVRVHGADFQIPTIKDRGKCYLFNDLQTMGVLYAAKVLLEYHTVTNDLEVNYSDFVKDTYEYFYEKGIDDYKFQKNAMNWLQFKLPDT